MSYHVILYYIISYYCVMFMLYYVMLFYVMHITSYDVTVCYDIYTYEEGEGVPVLTRGKTIACRNSQEQKSVGRWHWVIL